MNTPVTPLTLSDIFEETVTLIGKTFLRNLLLAVIFLTIPLVLMAIAADQFYSSFAEFHTTIAGKAADASISSIVSILGEVAFFFFSTLIFGLATLCAQIACSIVVSNEMQTQPVTWQDALTQTFQQKWIRGVGVLLLQIVIFAGAAIVVGLGIAILGAFSKILLGLLIVVLILAIIPSIFYFMIKWYFAVVAVAVDDQQVIAALKQSWNLVNGYWWRTFGLIVLFGLLSQFIVTIISLPITFGSMWNVYKDFFAMLQQTGGNIQPDKMLRFQQSFGPGVAISSGVSGILTLLMAPVYTVVFYYDLRARKTPSVDSSTMNTSLTGSKGPLDLNRL